MEEMKFKDILSHVKIYETDKDKNKIGKPISIGMPPEGLDLNELKLDFKKVILSSEGNSNIVLKSKCIEVCPSQDNASNIEGVIVTLHKFPEKTSKRFYVDREPITSLIISGYAYDISEYGDENDPYIIEFECGGSYWLSSFESTNVNLKNTYKLTFEKK